MFAAISALAKQREAAAALQQAQVAAINVTGVTESREARPAPPISDIPTHTTHDAPLTRTIEEIAQKLPPGLVPVRNDGAIVHNSSHLAAKCGRKHIQKYFISDIERGLVRECATCNGGTAFMRSVCVIGESLLEVPFVLEVDRYNNPVLNITLVPVKKPGDDYRRVDANGVTIYIHKTSSGKRINHTIAENLIDYNPCMHLRNKLTRVLPPAPRYVEDPPELPVIGRDVSERLCIDNT